MVLNDAEARKSYDRLIRIKLERQKRDNEMDSKRKDMKSVLLEKERLAKLRKEAEEAAKREFEDMLRNLREKSRKMPSFDDMFSADQSFEKDYSFPDIIEEVSVSNKSSDFEEYERKTIQRLRRFQENKVL